MRKLLIFGLLPVTFFMLVIIIFTRERAFAASRLKPPSFAIGPYKLDMSIVGLEGLVEITPAEYDVLAKTFKGEKIFKAPDAPFLGFSWDIRLGVVKDKIYKISLSLVIRGKRQADEALMKFLTYCKSKLGEPVEQQTGLFIWDTNDGNVILQNPLETPFGFVINLFSTSRAAKGYETTSESSIQALERFSNDIVKFQKQQQYMQVTLYKDISEKLMKELTFEPDIAKSLAAQIVNYYSGFDIDEQFKNMKEPNKSWVAKIRQLIIPKAEEMLKENYNLRRLIVYTLRMDIVYKFAKEGEKYLESDEKRRKESILIKFGAEFPEEANPKLFDKIFSDYFKVKF